MDRRIVVAVTAALATAAAGCSKGKSAAACQAEAHELATFLGSIDRDLPPYAQGELQLVTRAELPRTAWQRGPVVEVEAAEVRLQGGLVADGVELEERLAALRARVDADRAMDRAAGGQRADAPASLHLVIDARAPWSTVVWVAEAAHTAGFDRAAIAFAVPAAPVTPPPRSSVDDELDRIVASDDGSAKATRVAALTSKVVRTCPALARAFGEVGGAGDDLAQALIDALEPALVDCRCQLDVAALRAILFRMLHVEHPATALTITLSPDGRPVSQPATTPWRTASALVTADAPLRFAVAP